MIVPQKWFQKTTRLNLIEWFESSSVLFESSSILFEQLDQKIHHTTRHWLRTGGASVTAFIPKMVSPFRSNSERTVLLTTFSILRNFHLEMEEPSRSTSRFSADNGRTALVSRKKFLAGNSNDFKWPGHTSHDQDLQAVTRLHYMWPGHTICDLVTLFLAT